MIVELTVLHSTYLKVFYNNKNHINYELKEFTCDIFVLFANSNHLRNISAFPKFPSRLVA